MNIIITLTRLRNFDPPVLIYSVEISDDKQEWRETFGDLSTLDTWLKGLKAGFMLSSEQFVPTPEMPPEGYKSITKIGILERSRFESLEDDQL